MSIVGQHSNLTSGTVDAQGGVRFTLRDAAVRNGFRVDRVTGDRELFYGLEGELEGYL